MSHLLPLLAALAALVVAAFLRLGLRPGTLLVGAALVASALLAETHWAAALATVALFLGVALPLNHLPFRRRFLSAPLLRLYE
ncbi:MAG: hypothetical protein NZ898_17590, partial [Myxococcota bacterium]|nr:hypothetical protein [Myxococcota bacterium]MDW8364194.1 hypothetical protein [Myxococcales bacterium]